MTPDDMLVYEYARRDFAGMLGCPQCAAERRLRTMPEQHRGYRLMCYEVLRLPHECKQTRDAGGDAELVADEAALAKGEQG